LPGFESTLGHKFAPFYHSSRGEGNCLVKLAARSAPTFERGYPPWEPHIYFSTHLLGRHAAERLYEINYLALWEWDTGTRTLLGVQGSHQWDTERCAVLVSGPRDSGDLVSFTARQVYYAAHEGVRIGPWSLDNSRYLKYRRWRSDGPDVYSSKGKHASFVDLGELRRSSAGDSYDKPGRVAQPGRYELVDAGTLESPSSDCPWIAYTQGWGEQGISAVYDKLKSRLWDESGRPLRPIRRLTEEEVKNAQMELAARPSGQFDEQTLERAVATLPSDQVWATGEITDVEAKLMADRGIRVSLLE
jgi:hypothetical protein